MAFKNALKNHYTKKKKTTMGKIVIFFLPVNNIIIISQRMHIKYLITTMTNNLFSV